MLLQPVYLTRQSVFCLLSLTFRKHEESIIQSIIWYWIKVNVAYIWTLSTLGVPLAHLVLYVFPVWKRLLFLFICLTRHLHAASQNKAVLCHVCFLSNYVGYNIFINDVIVLYHLKSLFSWNNIFVSKWVTGWSRKWRKIVRMYHNVIRRWLTDHVDLQVLSALMKITT